MTNKRYKAVYENKNVHLITSFDLTSKTKIEKTLKSFNVKEITWTRISEDNSLYDLIDAKKINENVDVVFVGGGSRESKYFQSTR